MPNGARQALLALGAALAASGGCHCSEDEHSRHGAGQAMNLPPVGGADTCGTLMGYNFVTSAPNTSLPDQRATSTAGCCNVCTATPRCEAFSFYKPLGYCRLKTVAMPASVSGPGDPAYDSGNAHAPTPSWHPPSPSPPTPRPPPPLPPNPPSAGPKLPGRWYFQAPGVGRPATLTTTKSGGTMHWNLSSGLLSRSFCSIGAKAWTCSISTSIASESLPASGELLQRVVPEATMRINNTRVWVGGLDAPPAGAVAMTFVGLVDNSSHTAERYKWFPGERQTDRRTAWPPRGAAATLLFHVPCATIDNTDSSGGVLSVRVAFEAYVGLPVISKRLVISHSCANNLQIFDLVYESVPSYGGVQTAVTHFDLQNTSQNDGNVEFGYKHDGLNGGPGIILSAGDDWDDEHRFVSNWAPYGVYEDLTGLPQTPENSATLGPSYFNSQHLLNGRVLRVLTPQKAEHTLGADVVCYPTLECQGKVETANLKIFVDQAASVGLETVILAQIVAPQPAFHGEDGGWRGEAAITNATQEYMSWWKDLQQYANSKGIELGVCPRITLLLHSFSGTPQQLLSYCCVRTRGVRCWRQRQRESTCDVFLFLSSPWYSVASQLAHTNYASRGID
eukprot:COSAG02_NODE_9185_length_2298_cov_2.710778_2_plen_619_part_00